MHNEILDFYIPSPPTFGNVYNRKPPLNDFGIGEGIAAVALLASLAGTAVSYQASENQAKQSQLNAEAQNAALQQESQRQEAANQENQLRLAAQQQRQRQTQLANIAHSGIQTGTGTALALEADTWSQDQRALNDNAYINQLSQNQLKYQASNALALGDQQASQYKAAGTASLISGIGNSFGSLNSFNLKGGNNKGGSSNGGSSTALSSSSSSSL
jgi:hypothetical protein